MSYDPGTAPVETIRPLGLNQWAIDSFRTNGSYIVTLGDKPACQCPHWVNRLQGQPGSPACKHIVAVRDHVEQAARAERYRELELKAGSVDDETLGKLIEKYRQQPGPVLCALLGEAFDREQLPVPVPMPVFPTLDRVLANARGWGRQQKDAQLRAIFA